MASKRRDRLKVLAELPADELRNEVQKLELALFHAKLRHKGGFLRDTASLWRMRKEMARMKTVMSIAEAKGGAQ